MKLTSSAPGNVKNLLRLCLVLLAFVLLPLSGRADIHKNPTQQWVDHPLQVEAQLLHILETKQTHPGDDGVLRILAIGNSFSEDAIENYLHELAAEAGIKMIIGNMYIGGASLDLHWKNAQENNQAYEYRKISIDGEKTRTPNTSIATAIKDEQWDYISLQQVSGHSGQFETFEKTLPELLAYVKKQNPNPQTEYILHQTWAYAINSTHSNFPNYENDQQLMYDSIVSAVGRAKEIAGMDHMVPAGTAIQNGRSVLGEKFTRDGYHLSLELGRYTAACTWFEYLIGKPVLGSEFAPKGLTQEEIRVAQEAAHAAVKHSSRVTL